LVHYGVRAIDKFGHIEPQTFAAQLLQKLSGGGDVQYVGYHLCEGNISVVVPRARVLGSSGVDVVRSQVGIVKGNTVRKVRVMQ
jgi:hypothetical protein